MAGRLSEIEVFVKVVETGSFSAAAASLHLSPSAVSKIIGRIEARLGLPPPLALLAGALGGALPALTMLQVESFLSHALVLGCLYGLVLLTFTAPLVSLLQVKEQDVFEGTCAYLRIVGAGIPLTYVSAAITGAFNGAGNSRLSFWANAVGLAVNMVLFRLHYLIEKNLEVA